MKESEQEDEEKKGVISIEGKPTSDTQNSAPIKKKRGRKPKDMSMPTEELLEKIRDMVFEKCNVITPPHGRKRNDGKRSKLIRFALGLPRDIRNIIVSTGYVKKKTEENIDTHHRKAFDAFRELLVTVCPAIKFSQDTENGSQKYLNTCFLAYASTYCEKSMVELLAVHLSLDNDIVDKLFNYEGSVKGPSIKKLKSQANNNPLIIPTIELILALIQSQKELLTSVKILKHLLKKINPPQP